MSTNPVELASPSLSRAIGYINAHARLSLDTAIETLERLSTYVEALLILHEFDRPASWQGMTLADVIACAHTDVGQVDLIMQAIECCDGLFPLQFDETLEHINEAYPHVDLVIEIQNIAMSTDDIYEAVEDPASYLEPHLVSPASLEFYAALLDQGLAAAHWQKVLDFFGWPAGCIPACASWSTEYVIDDLKFRRLLVENDLNVFRSAFEIIWRTTGSVFLDYDPDDLGYGMYFTLDLATVRLLVEHWQRAQPFLRDLQIAAEMIAQNPAILTKIARLWNACAEVGRIGSKSRPGNTLLEIFTGQTPGEYAEND